MIPVFCSVVIPTIGRSTLARAINSVLEQSLLSADFEVIVVNDSGQDLKNTDWQERGSIRIVNTHRRERSFARNTGAAIAKGDYLYFLDDDDWMLPGALEHFWTLSCQAKSAAWLCGGIRVVDESGSNLGEVNSGLKGNCFAEIMGGAWAPLQASLIRSQAFFRVGGFSSFICGTEDLDLCRRISLAGDFANTEATVACLFRGNAWNTSTNYLRASEDTRKSRDAVLDEQAAFQRLLASGRSSPNSEYWFGRILRIYLSTLNFNIRDRRFFASTSRGIFGLLWIGFAGWRIFSSDFWRGVKDHHVPDTLHFIMEKYERGRNRP